MSFALALIVLTCGALAAILYHLRNAPEGFEDDAGFHFSSPPAEQLPRDLGGPLASSADAHAALFKSPSTGLRHREAH